MSSAQRPASGSPRLETLEDRWMPAIIGGFIHEDCNHNGVFESSVVGSRIGGMADELGIGGSTMQLLDGSGQVVSTTTADSSGRYEFTQRDNVSTTPQEIAYDVVFEQGKTDLTRFGSLQQFDPAMGQLMSVSIEVEGSIMSQVQFENLESLAADMKAELNGRITFDMPGTSQLSATVAREITARLEAFDGQADFQGTSAKDLGVTTMAGSFASAQVTDPSDISAYVGTGSVTVKETASAQACACGTGNLLAMVRSMASGKARVVYRYTPSNEIGPGQYTIVQVNQPTGYNDGLETSGNVFGIGWTNTSDRITLNVVSRTDVLRSNHFGEMKQASVSGLVYHDRDFSGSFSGPDTRLPGVTVQLRGTDIYGTPIEKQTTTDANGEYTFAGLTQGAYRLIEIQPGGYQQGTNSVGSAGGSVNGDTIEGINLTCGQQGTSYNFGETQPSTPIPPPPIVIPPPVTPPRDPLDIPPTAFGSKFFLIGRSWLDFM